MKCVFVLCLYNNHQDEECSFAGTEINEYGMCSECMVVEVPEDELTRCKNSFFEKIKRQQNLY